MTSFPRFFPEETFFPQKDLEDENEKILTKHAFWSAFKHQLSVVNQAIIAGEPIDGITDRTTTEPSNSGVDEENNISCDGQQEPREDAFLRSALGNLLPLFRLHLIDTLGDYADVITQINQLEKDIQTNYETEQGFKATYGAWAGPVQNISDIDASVNGGEGAPSPPQDIDNMDNATGCSTDSHGGFISFIRVALI